MLCTDQRKDRLKIKENLKFKSSFGENYAPNKANKTCGSSMIQLLGVQANESQ